MLRSPEGPPANRTEAMRSAGLWKGSKRTSESFDAVPEIVAHRICFEFSFRSLQPQLIQALVGDAKSPQEAPVPFHHEGRVDFGLSLCQRRPGSIGLCPHLHPSTRRDTLQSATSEQLGFAMVCSPVSNRSTHDELISSNVLPSTLEGKAFAVYVRTAVVCKSLTNTR